MNRSHLPEYFIEAILIGLFMFSAASFGVLLEAPTSIVRLALSDPLLRRVIMGIAMGTTAVLLIYSRWGKRSGAHMNPAVTITFWRLGKIKGDDALGYIVSQFIGATIGIFTAWVLYGPYLETPEVNFVATHPGVHGSFIAFIAEYFIAGTLMSAVILLSGHALTGFVAGTLVSLFIILEAPLSGMSMNPARSFSSNVVAGTIDDLWIYLTAPLLGMLSASWFVSRFQQVQCAKLVHDKKSRCIFCGFQPTIALILLFVSTSAFAESPRVMGIQRTVKDIRISTQFYKDALGFSQDNNNPSRLYLGEEFVEFVESKRYQPQKNIHGNDADFQHIAIVVRDMEEAYATLRKYNVTHISNTPQELPTWNTSVSGIKAFYFLDPDFHPVEIIRFPTGKGNKRWQTKDNKLFLGIDHTAIVIRDTAVSEGFYSNLGFRKVAQFETWGVEQEHLNGVFGARLRITSLKASPDSMGIELLEYLSPTTAKQGDHKNPPVQATIVSNLKEKLLRDADDHKLRRFSS